MDSIQPPPKKALPRKYGISHRQNDGITRWCACLVMRSLTRLIPLVTIFLLSLSSCKQDEYSPSKAAFARGVDLIMLEISNYRLDVRSNFHDRNFEELEKRATEARTSKAEFANATWKTEHFYTTLACPEDAPESTWKLHEEIHREWREKFPKSITARVAHADFLVKYGWHARGRGYTNEVTEEAWALLAKRLAEARSILEEAKSLPVKCPVLWQVLMEVAIGQSWSKPEFFQLFEEAKAIEPQYYPHDFVQARFLMTRWHGQAGDWEAAAEKEIDRPNGLGLEGYARVVSDQRGHYDDIFTETKASWPKTKEGFNLLRQRYPDSYEILNTYCRLACIAGEKAHAKMLFDQIGEGIITYCWGERKRFFQMRRWATY
jgi:hypothetical protein